MSASYDPPEIPDFDPEDYEYIDQPITPTQIEEWGTYYSEAPLRREIKRAMVQYKDDIEATKKYLLDIIEICPEQIRALRCVLVEHYPQHLKVVDQLLILL
jgi:hypothetical protein